MFNISFDIKVKRLCYTMVDDNDDENIGSQFKEAVKEWVYLYDELSELRRALSLKNKRYKDLSTFIINYMKHNDKEVCSLGSSGIVHMKSTKRKESINKNNVQEILFKKLQDLSLTDELTRSIFDERNTKESFRLTRSSNIIT